MPNVNTETKTERKPPQVILRANNVTTGHKGFIISHVTFELKSGDIFGLLGRSGSGKSTIITSIVGLRPPQSGSISFTIDGKEADPTQVIGYSPQRNALYPFLTIEENMRTFADLYHLPRAETDDRITELLLQLDLSAHADKRITQLSGGMEKRADLAVTLMHSPKVIVLDEPFNGLDISLQRFMWERLRDLARDGCIVIITSHLLDDVQRYCTKFGLVDNGKFHGNDELMDAIRKQEGMTLQGFLEQLFRRDIMMEGAAAKENSKGGKPR